MAQIIVQPLLSLCIPIYNRLSYLERQLTRMLEDKDLFEKQIQLIISDNCSTDDLRSCCEKYQKRGLKMHYHRNETNIGPDGNFDWCFHHADGKYVWLLGSDDIPVKGLLQKIIGLLNEDYGLLHLSMRKLSQELYLYRSSEEMAVAVNYWITFMSANIIRTDSLKTVDLSEYKRSFMIQVPAYLNACCSYQNNAVIYLPQYFEKENDGANNGGYNLFEVFITNLYGIFESFVQKGLLSKDALEKIKRVEYKEFLVTWIVSILILKTNKNFKRGADWKILNKHYGRKPYAYYYLFAYLAKSVFRKIYSWK